ncbi:ATP-grasp fold amidoligase family protein [Sporofaciens musculi]|uniref:ATP-grasp fold amidoligase family protein n=1 Tax=Sporofaciens musculi TaxID=2681861 RepID=UPI00216CAC76|nr:ATP-grasp fold amidoligase family protein [Sporofaciens musculi]MCI9422795.1 glycosyl transferase [Dorea sp.]
MKKKRISKTTKAFYIALSYVSPRLNTQLLFLKKFGRLPNLKNPQTLNEKLLKLKLEDFGKNELVRQCADKFRVRQYVKDCGLGHCLNELLAVYDSAEQIDWDSLPESFAMKWNFGCGYNLICPSKDALEVPAAKKMLEKWGREPFWAYFSELQYRGVHKKIIVEEYIGSEGGTPPKDYKFYCFNGNAYCVMVCVGREEGWPRFYFFDREFRLMRINRDSVNAPKDFSLPKPLGISEAFQIADRLSQGFPFVRVDLYLTQRGVRFGEMTFTPAAALDNKRLPKTDLLFGSLIKSSVK